QFVGVVPPSDVIITTTFEVEFESASGTIMVVIPYSTIEPIKQKLSSSYQSESDTVDSLWTQSMHEHVNDADAMAIVKLGETQMSIGDLVALEEGDVLPLAQEVSGELSIEIEGVKKLTCLAGEYKGNRAVQITKRIAK
ncbi:MAG: flagellar motor switch protein FliM, partial [Halobacteriovoraceae bacterium]|nr:flagellar motor switch protein FliM [Halobacteriovoraceae bacterium]